ncbi:MAG: hypothetical protein V3V74_06750 [Nitrosomonadaceae bacterium]
MPTIQLRLWDDTPQTGDSIKAKRDLLWYYIHDLVFDVMLVVHDDGGWEWVKHDTINNTPHLYNSRKTAQQQCSRLGQGYVKLYRWKR